MVDESVKGRLKLFLKEQRISKSEFGRNIGVSNAYVSSIRQSISPSVIKSIALNYPNLNIDWLLTGDGLMLRPDNEERETESDISYGIPLFNMDTFKDFGCSDLRRCKSECYYIVPEFENADFLIRMKGDSMYPRLNSGDLVACKLIDNTVFFQWNKIYVIYTKSHGVMIKRIKKSDLDGCILLASDNPVYDPIDVPLSDIGSVAAVVGMILVE